MNQLIFGILPVKPLPENTPTSGVALYAIGCITALILMYALIRKAKGDKKHRK